MGGDGDPLVRIRGLRRWHRRRGRVVLAADGVDLEIGRGEAVALVGRSGAGKSTVARCLARLEHADAGEIVFDGIDVRGLRGAALRAFRARVQLVLQDSAAALDPRLSALDIVVEPLEILGRGSSAERRRRGLELLDTVRLSPDHASRRPRELSGGQRQRLAIARALAVEPQLLILDEAFAGLDAPVQGEIAALLEELRRRRGLTFLHVSHDLALMSALAERVAVLEEGRIVEDREVGALFADPRHPLTRALVEAVPVLPPISPAP